MFPGGNANADLGFSKHAHAQPQFLAQPLPPPHFPLPVSGGAGLVTPLVATGMPLAMQGEGGVGIDWAQLAQQWIHMRDAGPLAAAVTMPVAPPPPIIGNVSEYHQQAIAMPLDSVVRTGHPLLEEHGEADMDMDDDNERGHGGDTPPPPAPMVTPSQWLAASESHPGSDVATSNPCPPTAAAAHGKQPWNNWQAQPGKPSNPTAHIPSLLKLNVSNPNEPRQQLHMRLPVQVPQQQTQSHHEQQQPQDTGTNSGASNEIDANKRKMLPAWIREGLEKMEREKLRQMERQHPSMATTTDVETNHVKQVSSKTLTTPVNLLNISNVASDSEDSMDLPGQAVEEPMKKGKEMISKDVISSDDQEDDHDEPGKPETSEQASAANDDRNVNGKNFEERLADLMLAVRRTLTEILLETTNEEIAAIAGETLKEHRAKASSAQVIRKSALSSITGNLGLAAYGDSSSESEEDEDDEENDHLAGAAKDADKSVHLSVEELKTRIRRSKRTFERVIDDIEDRMAKQDQRDEQALQRHRKRELDRSDIAKEQSRPLVDSEPLGDLEGRPAHDKLRKFNAGKRPSRKERTTRFSDNKDGKQQSQSYVHQVVAVAAVAPLSSAGTNAGPQKLKPVPNPATNLLQMPESVTSMLNAADKALHKANKSTRKVKSARRRSSSTSASSSSSSSTSSSDSEDSNSTSSGSKTSSSRGKRSSRHYRRGRSSKGSSRSKYDRRDRDKETERDRDRDRERRQQRHHCGGNSSSRHHHQRDRRRRDSSHSGGDDRGSRSYHRTSRPSSSRSTDHGSSSRQQAHRTRSRSKSRSTHHSHTNSNAYFSSSSASHTRKRH